MSNVTVVNNTVRLLIAKYVKPRQKGKTKPEIIIPGDTMAVKVLLLPGVNSIEASKWNLVKSSNFIKSHMDNGDIEVQRARYKTKVKAEKERMQEEEEMMIEEGEGDEPLSDD